MNSTGLATQDEQLVCLSCGETYLHHYRVDTYSRKEDSKHGLHVRVTGASVVADSDMEGNPSSRRGGIKIYFWCECCSSRTIVHFAQHKGVTDINTYTIDCGQVDCDEIDRVAD